MSVADAPSQRLGRRWLTWLGFAISGLLVVVLMARLDWPDFWAALRQLRLAGVAASTLAVCGAILLRTLRWNLAANVPLNRFRHFWSAVRLGYLGNLIYPARAGEALRLATLNRFGQLPGGQVIASAVLDRLADVMALGVCLVLTVALYGAAVIRPQALAAAAAVIGLLIAGVGVVWWRGERWQAGVERLAARLPAGWDRRLPAWYAQAVQLRRLLRSPVRVAGIAAASLLAFACDFLSLWLMMRAFGWDLPLRAGLITGIVIAAGVALPTAPGSLGVYQAACVFALGQYGIPEAGALAYSVVHQLAGVVLIGALAAGPAWRYGLQFGNRTDRPDQV